MKRHPYSEKIKLKMLKPRIAALDISIARPLPKGRKGPTKTAARGYGSKWRTAREAFLTKHPTCVLCGVLANVVDHIVDHRGDQKLFWDRNNWQALCQPCHSTKTASTPDREPWAEVSGGGTTFGMA